MSRFRPGGPVAPGEVYVDRRADAELLAALLDAEYCYVLGPTQMGKTSLAIQTKVCLEEQGVRCAYLDLQGSGSGTPEQWYNTLIDTLGEELGIELNWLEGPLADQSRTPADKWRRFLEQLTTAPDARFVIFIDEINQLLRKAFSTELREEFITSIRATYNLRSDGARHPGRLTFCLLGIASPDELIRDPRSAPFNIGRAIQLNDFLHAEAIVTFREELTGLPGEPDAWFDAIYEWTSGHPYMTQRLCWELFQRRTEGEPEAEVAAIVDKIFLADGRASEPNLKNAERELGRHESAMQAEMLTLYRGLLKQPVQSLREDPVHRALRLTGMAAERRRKKGQLLTVRNRVFARVFDRRWVDERLRQLNRPFQAPLSRWLDADKQESTLPIGVEREKILEQAKITELTAQEREFVLACENAAVRGRFSWGLVAVVVVVVSSSIMTLYARRQQQIAEAHSQEIERARQEAEDRARRLGNQELRSQFLQAIGEVEAAVKERPDQTKPEVIIERVKAMLPRMSSSFVAIDADYATKLNDAKGAIAGCEKNLGACQNPKQDPCKQSKDDLRDCKGNLNQERRSREAKESELLAALKGHLTDSQAIDSLKRDLDQARAKQRDLEDAKQVADKREQSCRGDLEVCGKERASVQAGAAQCSTDLIACKVSVEHCAQSLGASQSALTTCTASLAACQQSQAPPPK